MKNKEIIKAINKKEKKQSAFRKWWKANSYKVWRIVLFPLGVVLKIQDIITKALNNRNKWDETRAKAIFDYYIPRRAEWEKENNEFYFFDNGYGWSIYYAKRYLKRKDRRFWKVNSGWCGGDLRNYLIDCYELEGFTKEIYNCSDGQTELVFKMN